MRGTLFLLIVYIMLAIPAAGFTQESDPGAAPAPEIPVPEPVPLAEAPEFVRDTLLGLWESLVSFLPLIVVALVIILITGFVSRVSASLWRRGLARSRLRRPLQALFVRFIRFGIWLVGLLVAAIIVFPNLTPTKVLGGLGIASVAFGLIFKEFFENFFAGILILWRFPMDVGDVIECQEIVGRVEEISVRMTLIRQVSDELVLVPNKFLTENPVLVLTNLPKRRVLTILNIGYGGALEDAVKVIHDTTARCATVDRSKRIEVFPFSLSPNSIDVELAWWTDPTPFEVRRSLGEVTTAVKRALDDAGIEMPTPYRTVVFKNPLDVKTECLGRSGESGADEDKG